VSSRVSEPNLVLCLIVTDIFGDHVYGADTMALGRNWCIEADASIDGKIEVPVNLGMGRYQVSPVAYCGDRFAKKEYYHWAENAAAFEVQGNIGEPFFGRDQAERVVPAGVKRMRTSR
jgi:hypothetical protein